MTQDLFFHLDDVLNRNVCPESIIPPVLLVRDEEPEEHYLKKHKL